MKNYKHASKNVNGMKLAAVASAAVMLAPVAMSSVSSFAKDYSYDATTNHNTYYPAYPLVDYKTGSAAGTNGQINSPLVGFSVNDLQAAMDKANAISTQYEQDSKTSKQDAAKALTDAGDQVQVKADTLVKNLQGDGSYFTQLSGKNQDATNPQYQALAAKQFAIYSDLDKADSALKEAATKADNADAAYKAAQNVTTASRKATFDGAYEDAKTAYNNVVKSYSGFIDDVKAVDTTVARQTNNGAVTEAANEAALAMSKLVPGSDAYNAAKAAYDKAQGDYLVITQTVSASTPAGVAKLDAAATAAVAALKKIASDNYDGSTSKLMGTVHVNYNKNYGIQIWTKDGSKVVYNSVDAAAAGKKTGDAKKLAGQSNWKVFNDKYTANGTTYYNLGGDQYIDAAYVTFTPAK